MEKVKRKLEGDLKVSVARLSSSRTRLNSWRSFVPINILPSSFHTNTTKEFWFQHLSSDKLSCYFLSPDDSRQPGGCQRGEVTPWRWLAKVNCLSRVKMWKKSYLHFSFSFIFFIFMSVQKQFLNANPESRKRRARKILFFFATYHHT